MPNPSIPCIWVVWRDGKMVSPLLSSDKEARCWIETELQTLRWEAQVHGREVTETPNFRVAVFRGEWF